MKGSGKNATLDFGGTEYRCIVTAGLSGTIDVITAACSVETGNAITHNAIGAESHTATLTLLLDTESVAQEQAFGLGVSGIFIMYPAGNIVDEKSYTFTNAFVTTTNKPIDVAGLLQLEVGFTMDGAETPAIITV